MSKAKETEFFNNNYDKGLAWYEDMFPDEQYTARGEISTMYYLDADVPNRIKAHYSDIKILFGAREPEALLDSFYKFGIRRGLAAESLTAALNQPNAIYMGSGYNTRLAANALTPGDRVTMLDSVRLSRYLDAFIETFGQDKVHVVSFSALNESPKAEIERIYRFIGVNTNHEPPGLLEKTNPSLAPKNKTLALAAHKLAYALRKLGLHAVLARLHKSEVLKRFLFRPQSDKPAVVELPEQIKDILANESALLKDRLNALHNNNRPMS